MRTRLYATILTFGVLVAVASQPAAPRAQAGVKAAAQPASQARTQEQLLQDAIQLMNTKGDYPAAAKLFEAASKGKDRNRAALALLYLAQVYEKQGRSEAARTLRDLIDRFADQTLIVAEARVKLAALTAGSADRPPGKMVRSNWAAGDVFDAIAPPSRDGQYMPGIDWSTRELMLVELATRKVRRIAKQANGQGAAVAPDNREIAFVAFVAGEGNRPGADEVRVVTFDGTGTKTIHRNEGGDTLLSNWTPDGKSGMYLVDATTAQSEFVAGVNGPPEWAPDGSRFVVRTDKGLEAIDLATRERREVYHTSSAVHQFITWSHDGTRIAFAEWTSMADEAPLAVRVVPAGGGDAVTVWTAPSQKHGIELAGWSPDDRELLFVQRVPGAFPALYRIPVSGGTPRPMGLSADGLRDARISPDGRHVAYTAGWQTIETRILENFLPPLEPPKPAVNK